MNSWKYDIQSNEWSRDGFGGDLFYRLSLGVTAQSTVHKKRYYVGGAVVPGGNRNMAGIDGAAAYVVSGLLALDLETLQWRNSSSLGMNRYGTVMDGFMNLIEGVGEDGVLVVFGGVMWPVGSGLGTLSSGDVEDAFYVCCIFYIFYPFAMMVLMSRIQWNMLPYTTLRMRNGTPSKLPAIYPPGECRDVASSFLPRMSLRFPCKHPSPFFFLIHVAPCLTLITQKAICSAASAPPIPPTATFMSSPSPPSAGFA